MEQCKDCVHFRYVYKGLEPNYSGCEKCSVTIGNPYKCTAYKRISFWKRFVAWLDKIRFVLFLETNGKIDLGVSHKFQKISEELVWENLHKE